MTWHTEYFCHTFQSGLWCHRDYWTQNQSSSKQDKESNGKIQGVYFTPFLLVRPVMLFFLFLVFFPVWYPSNLQWGFVTPLSIPCSSCVFWGNVGCNCGWFIANDVNVCTLTKWCQDNLFFFPFFQLYACCWLLLLLLPSRKRDTKKLGACVLRNPVWF